MKRIPRQPEKFEILTLHDALARLEGSSFNLTTSDGGAFLDLVGRSLDLAKKNPALLHGKRAEAMFGAIAASLDRCALIKEEDSGETFSRSDVLPADYRLVLDSGKQILVEVKNHHPSDPMRPFSLKASYVSRLVEYSHLVQTPLYFAVFWARWSLWSLLPLSAFTLENETYSVPMDTALMANHMALIGDYQVGTTPPLVLRRIADRSKPRSVDPQGHCGFTIGAVELFCAGTRVEDKVERAIAHFLLLFGKWEVSEPVDIQDGLLNHVDMVAAPAESDENQGFAMFGPLSTMISRYYSVLTESETGVQRLTPRRFFRLMPSIPSDYVGKALPMWRILQKPSKLSSDSSDADFRTST